MPDPTDVPRRRRVLVTDVTQAAAEVSRSVHEACDLTCPWSPASGRRNALVCWAVLAWVKRAIGIDRGWDAAYRLVSTLDLPGPPADISPDGP